jgi:molybdate transport system ATP-binding protein
MGAAMNAPVLDIRARFRLDLGGFRLHAEFTTPRHGVTALFGPSGSGKTTLLRCIAGLTRAPQGRLDVGDECWQDDMHFVPVHRRVLGYVFQEPSLFAHLSVRGNLEYGMRRVRSQDRHVAFEQATELLGLGALLDRDVTHLSGGERQRVAIARALLTNPRLLLMDEPLAALDQASKADILPYLERLHRQLSIPVIYVSHSLEEVTRMADHMVLIENGTVTAHGPLDAMLTRLDLSLAHGDSASAIVNARVAEHDTEYHLTRFDFDGGQLLAMRTNAPIGAPCRVRIQARDVSLALVPPQQSSVLNSLPVRVTDVIDDGPGRTIVRVLAGNTPLLARVTRKSASALGLVAGTHAYAQIKSVALLD